MSVGRFVGETVGDGDRGKIVVEVFPHVSHSFPFCPTFNVHELPEQIGPSTT
jgi:hypothetical protein